MSAELLTPAIPVPEAPRHPEEAHPELAAELRRQYRAITEGVIRPIGSPGPWWKMSLGICLLLILWGAASWAVQIRIGMGVTALQHPVMWAVYITNFVWWIAVAHSGTFISAVLYLFRAPFRAAFSRLSEAMTIFAVMTAGLFPLIHLGRTWRAYWLFPYPNERSLWPNFRSPLILDVFAVSTYLTVSFMFWWLGMVPDLAICRDRLRGWRRTIYGWLSLGWDGTHRQWRHYEMTTSILAGLATPLVLSVHSCVSWDFALGLVPGWHSTMFAPYFVDGAIFQGLAMVLVLAILTRHYLKLEEFITLERLDQIAKLTLLTGIALTWFYCSEYFMTWYRHEPSEVINLVNKVGGPWAWMFWLFTFCNCVAPLAFCWRQMRRNLVALFSVGILIQIGMWLERFVIIAASLARDYNPYSWAPAVYRPSWVEIGICFGSLGWFLFWFLMFSRFLPVLPIADLKKDALKEHREKLAERVARG